MQCLEVSGAVPPLYGSLGVKGLNFKILFVLPASELSGKSPALDTGCLR